MSAGSSPYSAASTGAPCVGGPGAVAADAGRGLRDGCHGLGAALRVGVGMDSLDELRVFTGHGQLP